MYATIRRYTIARGAARELAERVESEVVPLMRAIEGFVSYALVEGERRDGRDTLAAVSVYETKAGADESVKQASAWVRATCAAWQPVMTDVTAGEMVVSASGNGAQRALAPH